MVGIDHCYNIADLRRAAKRRLPKGIFEYIDRGSEDEVALAHNRAAFDRLKLKTRVLEDLRDLNTDVELLGDASAIPLAIAPTGIAGLCSYEGELALAKAAANAGVPFTLATGSITSMEKIAEQARGRLWFQLYMWQEEALSYQLVQRAKDAGFEALVVTVDAALGNNREYNQRNGFSIPFKVSARSIIDMLCHPRWMVSVLGRYLATSGMPRHENYPARYQHRIAFGSGQAKPVRQSGMTWADIGRLREFWPGKFIVKGILRPEDALLAIEHGADGIVVSNHGGRNLDSSVASIDALPDIVAAVAGRATVLFDSGIRRGSDIAKALALGADSVLVGRATLYGVAAGGQRGAEHALKILRSELRKTMAYLGCTDVSELTPDIFAKTAPVRRETIETLPSQE
ncbi:MAG: alpha-hydroxy acid oxidase [Marinobacter sp.]|uniref:alpha-hydroxy acid oxidase n=1 Tax=Marinobacter sp. TaxID=50741 RepID=UPI0032999005